MDTYGGSRVPDINSGISGDVLKTGDQAEKLLSANFKPIKFTGETIDYFTIWLSNLLLSIITLGIYSAWAKVRRVSYFYNHTRLEETGLIYHAKPKTILIGRLLAFGALVIINLVANFAPVFSLALMPIILFALPWIMNRSMSFSARMTSWRNVRFQWHGTYWRTFMWMLIGPFLAAITLGILAPWVSKKSYQYYADNHSFGTSPFSSFAKTGDYYKAFLWGAIVPFVVIAVVFALMIFLLGGDLNVVDNPVAVQFIPMGLLAAFVVASITYRTLARNILINALVLDNKVEFRSDLSAKKVVWITVTNLLATVFTLGLMSAWAQVRLYRYTCEHTHYCTTGDIGAFIDEETAKMGAFGEEFADLDGLEFGI